MTRRQAGKALRVGVDAIVLASFARRLGGKRLRRVAKVLAAAMIEDRRREAHARHH
jgi:hypothetical protein